MSTFLRPQTGSRKGIAQFYQTTAQTAVTTEVNLNIFGTVVLNDSTGIVKVSDSQVTLKGGKKYKITCNCNAEAFSDTAVTFAEFALKIDGTTKAIYQASSLMVTNTAINFQRSGPLIHVHTAAADATLTITCKGLNGSVTINSGSPNVIIEELEEFIPQANGSTSIQGDLTVSGGIKLPGTAPAPGYVGEYIRQNAASAVALAGSSTVVLVEKTLPAGVWAVTAHVATTVSASGNQIYMGLATTPGGLLNEFAAYNSGETGKRRQVFTDVITSDGTKIVKATVQCVGSATGNGLYINGGAETSYIIAHRIA